MLFIPPIALSFAIYHSQIAVGWKLYKWLDFLQFAVKCVVKNVLVFILYGLKKLPVPNEWLPSSGV